MAKAPRPGQVKTRLEPLLGPAGCAVLQAGLIRRAAAWARAIAPGAAWVAFDPPNGEEEVRALTGDGVGLLAQVDGDLGARLAAATAAVLAVSPGPVVVVGTDMPTLGPGHAQEAFGALRDGADVCFGPAHDGGYYLVGLTRPAPAVFALPGEAWGGPEVLARSLDLARAAGLEVALTGLECDLDEPADVAAALARGDVPADIATLLSAP
ncbi:MAG: TIGR04282 family arsenosugar biosynthesis glycosyltransferase [Solirubrobacteraceae bacterium]